MRVWVEKGGPREGMEVKERERRGFGEGMEGRGRQQDLVRVWREESENSAWRGMEGRGREQDLVRHGGKMEGTGSGEGMEGRGMEQDMVSVWG